MVVTSDAGEKSPSAASPVLHSRAGGEGQQQVQHQAPAVRLNHSDGPVKKEDSADVLLINSSSKRKHEDMGDAESDATDVESDDLDDEEELGEDDCDEDDAFDPSPRTGSSPIQSTASTTTTTTSITKTTKATTATTTPVSIKSRRPSRSCKPNSLIFNSDTTTLSPKRRRKIVRESLPPSPAADLIQSNQKSSGRKSTISSRSFARESVRKAVSALTGVNRPVKKLGRPRKYPIEVTGESVSSVKNGRIPVGRAVKGRKVGRGKKLTAKKGSPVGKCTPILTAILSGQSLAQTKTGRPKGRPRVLPSLDEVILNGAKSSPHTSATRSSPRRCDCEAKYKKILSNLEQSLEVRFAESTYKLRKDMEHTEAENSRLQNRIASLQRELDYLKNRLDHAKETTASRQEIDELKLKHQYELSLAKRTQWCSNCERESIYFCCWNSSYCSLECQQHHWHAVHKKVCRNKDVKR